MARPAGSQASGVCFLVGCGRSGTTILGRVLGAHPMVRFVNDRFQLWIEPFPFADIWGLRVDEPGNAARVVLTAEDAARAPLEARQQFLRELTRLRHGRAVVVEKLAINAFRLGFVRALVPDARVIWIIRDGVDVARSIARRIEAGLWLGRDDRKWSYLVALARQRGLGAIASRCATPYEMGLLEWRLSVEAVRSYVDEHGEEGLSRVRYERLLEDPGGEADRLAAWLGLPPSEAMRRFAMEQVIRRAAPSRPEGPPAATETIAGELLRQLGYASATAPERV